MRNELKYDYSVEMGLEWFECFDEAKERYETYGMDGLMDYYDPDGHSLYGRVLGQDNTADRHRTFDGSKKYLEDQLLARYAGDIKRFTNLLVKLDREGFEPKRA